MAPGDADADEVGDGGAHGALELEAEELRVALEHARHVAGLDVHPLEVLDDGREVDDDAGVEHLRVAAEQVRELVAADADLAEVVEDGDHVLADVAAEGERVGGEVVEAEAEGAKELRRAPALFCVFTKKNPNGLVFILGTIRWRSKPSWRPLT